MPTNRVQQAGGWADWHPAAGGHVKMPTGLQRATLELGFQFSGGGIPVGGQAEEAEILEEHVADVFRGAAQYSDALELSA